MEPVPTACPFLANKAVPKYGVPPYFPETPPSTIRPSRFPKAMSAAERIGVTPLSRSAPSFGGIRESFGYGEPIVTSPTAAIVIGSLFFGAASVCGGAVLAVSSLPATFGWHARSTKIAEIAKEMTEMFARLFIGLRHRIKANRMDIWVSKVCPSRLY